MTIKKDDKNSWAIRGGILMGIVIGFFFLRQNPLAFVGCIILGLGFRLVVKTIFSSKREQYQ